ncbi:OsmC family protein [Bradyrhizobium sp. CCBAU 51753]|uniref:OsmC family protein n=1 Tax=Bradyrhizobium sp. CCBAU 51753 TaxID=1325100 RepID=UPI00188A9CDC|nr:OsmC family protein [Bradyrhizobium sp. CCBAU 51753]
MTDTAPESMMTNSNGDRAPRPQAEVAGDLSGAGTLNGRAGTSVFSIGGPDGRGGTAVGANPYELLSASLAACTAMTIRLQARRRNIPLSHVEVGVSYHHGSDGGRDSFERSIRLEGELGNDARDQLMQAANMCPVGRTLGLTADIRTNDNVGIGSAASYDDDLNELPIPYIDPD